MMKKVLIIIPAFNEEENIERVVNEIVSDYAEYDYVVINDGSKDKTAEICRQKGYSVINLPVNLGLAGAFQTGMKYAYLKGYEYAIQFDADGQHRPEYIASMLEKLQSGYDIVIGSRFFSKKKPRNMRMFGSRLISCAIRIMTGKRITDPTSGMRMYDRDMIEKFANYVNYGPEPDTISYLMRHGIKVAEVQVEMAERVAGESYLKPVRAIVYMMRMMSSILLIQNFRRLEGKR